MPIKMKTVTKHKGHQLANSLVLGFQFVHNGSIKLGLPRLWFIARYLHCSLMLGHHHLRLLLKQISFESSRLRESMLVAVLATVL